MNSIAPLRNSLLPRQWRNHQRGVVLFVGLIMLLLLSLIGITAMQVTLLQERMAGNFFVQHVGFEAGEKALSDGRNATRTLANSGAGLTLDYFSMVGPSTQFQFPWTTWLTSETFPPAAPYASPMAARRWAPGQGASLPTNGNALSYYSIAAFGADSSTDAKTALQGIYVF